MGVLVIRKREPEPEREWSVDPVRAKGFTRQLQALREQYQKVREMHNIDCVSGRRIKKSFIDRIQGIEFQIFWYDDGTSRGQCIRIADIPGTLSGEILRLRQRIPEFELVGEDYEIVGNEVRRLVGQQAPPPALLENLTDDSEDPTDLVELLPVFYESGPSILHRSNWTPAKHRSEIVNVLRCQGGFCPGTPISPYITQLLGKSPRGHLVFEKLLYGEFLSAFERLYRYKGWILNLISALRTLHSLGIIHRNLCIDNLYFRLQNNETILVVGGISGQGGNTNAPEIPSQLALDSDFTEKTDIYDIGELIKSLVYEGPRVTEAEDRTVPYPLQDIVEACQHTSPELRPGLDSLQSMVEKIPAVGAEGYVYEEYEHEEDDDDEEM